MLAPIVIFVYNRPWHTQQTIEALQKNELANLSELFIYADGAKNAGGNQVKEVSDYIKTVSGFKKITIIERNKNWGLAKSIIDGVTETVNKFGSVIVLEDDIVTSPGFLKYMNNALQIYKDEEKVMHISGYMFPIKGSIPETFFIKPTSCWGWATWARAWNYFEKDAQKQINQISKRNGWNEFTINNSYQSHKMQLELNLNGSINTWAVFWYATVFLKGGLTLHPFPSLVQNIGFDGTGENCGDSSTQKNPFKWNQLANKIEVNKKVPRVNKKVINKLVYFFKSNKRQLTLRDKFYLFRKNGFKEYLHKIIFAVFNSSKIALINDAKKKSETIERFKSGSTILFDKEFEYVDLPSFNFIYNELFNLEIYKFKTINDTPLIIDCGANIGLSVLYFKKLYPNAKIIAFEPDPNIFKTLEKNVKNYNLFHVELHQKALWDKEEDLTFYSEGADGGRIDQLDIENKNIISLKTTILSAFLTQKVDFLKIDIEGAEFKVLNECKEQLHLVDNLFVEYHSLVKEKQCLSDLLKILSDSGFRYFISSIGIKSQFPFIKRNETLGMDNQLNIFATKNNIS